MLVNFIPDRSTGPQNGVRAAGSWLTFLLISRIISTGKRTCENNSMAYQGGWFGHTRKVHKVPQEGFSPTDQRPAGGNLSRS